MNTLLFEKQLHKCVEKRHCEGEVSSISSEFIQKIIRPYRDNCRYLKQAFFQQKSNDVRGFITSAEFAIDESCYIDDTGHFNAVEYNICYNQIAYIHLGYCIKYSLIEELSDYTLESFFAKQLSNFLIINLNSNFRSKLNARNFYGNFGITSVRRHRSCTFIDTYCVFIDDEKGHSKGEITLAVLNC